MMLCVEKEWGEMHLCWCSTITETKDLHSHIQFACPLVSHLIIIKIAIPLNPPIKRCNGFRFSYSSFIYPPPAETLVLRESKQVLELYTIYSHFPPKLTSFMSLYLMWWKKKKSLQCNNNNIDGQHQHRSTLSFSSAQDASCSLFLLSHPMATNIHLFFGHGKEQDIEDQIDSRLVILFL